MARARRVARGTRGRTRALSRLDGYQLRNHTLPEVRVRMTETATTSRAQRFRSRIPRLLVWYCRIVALASILSALSPRTNERIDQLPDYILFSLGFLLGVPSIGFGVLM